MQQRRRRQGEAEIRDAAMTLFAQKGYAATTVVEIAETSGVSARTFFRYYRSKEDLLVDAPLGYGEVLASALEARPSAESPLDAVSAALRLRTRRWQERPDDGGAVRSLLEDNPALAIRMSGKTDEWSADLAAALAPRLDPPDNSRRLRARAVVGAAIACLDAAFTEWQRTSDASLDDLFDSALGAVSRAAFSPASPSAAG